MNIVEFVDWRRLLKLCGVKGTGYLQAIVTVILFIAITLYYNIIPLPVIVILL